MKIIGLCSLSAVSVGIQSVVRQSAIRNVSAALSSLPSSQRLCSRIAFPSRTPDGHPDLQGIWANDTVTPLERPNRFGDKAVLTEQEAVAYERDLAGRWRDRFGELEVATTGELSPEWQENGTVVPGRRTSLIVDPSSGKVPLKPEARARADAQGRARAAHPADDPEERTLYERCLIGSAGPPMMPPVYNQNCRSCRRATAC